MRSLFLVLALMITTLLTAQRQDFIPGQLIVQLKEGVVVKHWLADQPALTDAHQIGRRGNRYLLRFDHNRYVATTLRDQLWRDPAVEIIQRDKVLAYRRRPNDPRYGQQWHHRNIGQLGGENDADFRSEAAWDLTTGGLTVNGDTIVVAVLDDGVDLDHEDLIGNLWINYEEIPDNGIDDDGNGYVDDYNGFDSDDDDGNPGAGQSDNHGTPVNGLIGATGNNGTGVAGMNWTVKLMNIRNGFLVSESEVLQAYAYALEMRQRYNETNGERGAYVVVTNASWGEDGGRPEDSPIWCGFYEELGAAGILNVGATANSNVDVDTAGDLPTNCPSDYLVGVTNVNTFDEKVRQAGFGATSIDLGAYGEDAFTTGNGNGYESFGGTSAAAPMVAGAIALLYSANCANFGELLAADPAAAALRVRRALLESTKPNASLAGITVTGGVLDARAALDNLLTGCDQCLTPTSFTVKPQTATATALMADFRTTASITTADLRYRPTGTSAWTTLSDVSAPLVISGLAACSSYDVQLLAGCGASLVETEVLTVATDGCCVIPEDFTVTAQQNEFFTVSWSEQLAGRFYRVRYREAGTENWLTRTSNADQLGLAGGIKSCTDYEFEFQTDCDTFVTDFGRRMTITSTGCGSCNEVDYCEPDLFDNSEEWIERVDLGGLLVRRSGPEGAGYVDAGATEGVTFVRGGVYPITIDAGFTNGVAEEEFRVYVDWDQNGIFRSNEIAFEAKNEDGTATGFITVPEDADTLLTRMRVMMQFRNVRGGPCPIVLGSGEVEDYCIMIQDAIGCAAPPVESLSWVFDEDDGILRLRWGGSAAVGGSYRVRYRPVNGDGTYTEVDVDSVGLNLPEFSTCEGFEAEVASLCGEGVGEYAAFSFPGNICTSLEDLLLADDDWSVFPNPAAGVTNLRWSSGIRAQRVELYDLLGSRLRTADANGTQSLRLRLDGLAAGVYVLRLVGQDGKFGTKRLVVR